jgi:hypothetical protein
LLFFIESIVYLFLTLTPTLKEKVIVHFYPPEMYEIFDWNVSCKLDFYSVNMKIITDEYKMILMNYFIPPPSLFFPPKDIFENGDPI